MRALLVSSFLAYVESVTLILLPAFFTRAKLGAIASTHDLFGNRWGTKAHRGSMRIPLGIIFIGQYHVYSVDHVGYRLHYSFIFTYCKSRREKSD